MRGFILAALLALTVSFVAMPSVSQGAEAKILDTVVGKYNAAAKGWEPVLKQAAKRLFITLCIISLVFTAGYGFLRGGMGLGDFFTEFLRFGITMGIFYYLLENGPVMAKAIIDSMTLLGQNASSTYNVKLTPSDICTQGFGLIYDAVAEFGKSDYATGVMVIVIALMIALVYAVIAAQMVVLLCSSWILIYGGVFYLGFGGGNWTSDIAKNYFKTVFAQAMQVFTFCLLLGIGQAEIRSLTVGLRTTKSVTVANYRWLFGLTGEDATKVVTSETLTMTGMCVALVFAVILCILVSRVPGMIAGVINGSSISAMAFSGVGGAVGSARNMMGSAAGMATGAGMMMAQASGAGMALSSAYKAMQDHKANGEGAFAKGKATTGLRGLKNSLSDMKSSLKSSYAQTRTTPGMMSSNIDGKVQQRQAEREKEKAEKEKQTAQNGASGGSPGEAKQNLDTGASKAGGGDAASSGADANGGKADANPFDGGGTLFGPSSEGGGGNGSSASEEAGEGGRHGVSADGYDSGQDAEFGQSAFDDDGGFSYEHSEYDDEIAQWRAAVENHDPSKIGLPDSE